MTADVNGPQSDVLRELPPKREQIVAVELSGSQKQVGGGAQPLLS